MLVSPRLLPHPDPLPEGEGNFGGMGFQSVTFSLEAERFEISPVFLFWHDLHGHFSCFVPE